jgi:hypothetical protein
LPRAPRPCSSLYRCALDFVEKICFAINPRATIDLQSFLWGQGSGEYPNAHGPIAQRIDPTRVLHFGANKDFHNKVHRHRTALFCTAKNALENS